jgi:hypothetical protein
MKAGGAEHEVTMAGMCFIRIILETYLEENKSNYKSMTGVYIMMSTITSVNFGVHSISNTYIFFSVYYTPHGASCLFAANTNLLKTEIIKKQTGHWNENIPLNTFIIRVEIAGRQTGRSSNPSRVTNFLFST